MLLNRLQVFIFCLLFVTCIYHMIHSDSIYLVSKPLSDRPPITPLPPIYFPILLKMTLQANKSKAYRPYQRQRPRKYNYSSYYQYNK